MDSIPYGQGLAHTAYSYKNQEEGVEVVIDEPNALTLRKIPKSIERHF
jgi:hypothetical protein